MRLKEKCDCPVDQFDGPGCFHGALRFMRVLSDLSVMVENRHGYMQLRNPLDVTVDRDVVTA